MHLLASEVASRLDLQGPEEKRWANPRHALHLPNTPTRQRSPSSTQTIRGWEIKLLLRSGNPTAVAGRPQLQALHLAQASTFDVSGEAVA
jgi:hypothetical protein